MNFSANTSKHKKNATGMAVVGLFHVALAVLILQGSRITIAHPPPVVDATLLASPQPQPPPRMPEPEMLKPEPVMPPIFVPKPEVLAIDDTLPVIVATDVKSDQPRHVDPPGATVSGETDGPPAARAEPVRVAPKVEASACAKPEYPAGSLRNGDSGVVTLALLVGTDGRVADAKVERSSGFRELDRAARTGLSLCRFTPGTVDGVPYQSWTRMQYVWSVE